MKRSFTTAFFSMLTAASLLTACKTDPVSTPEYSFVGVTNASPSTATYNIFFDAGMLIPAALPFDGNVAYKQVIPATYTVKLTPETSNETKFSKQFSFGINKGYSLFIIGRAGKTEGADKLDVLQIEDELRIPATDKALIRFINLSPDAAALNLHEKDKEAIISDKAYKSISTFVEVDARKYIFDIKDKASNQSKGLMAEYDIKKGGIYTIIAKGMLTPGENEKPFGGLVVVN